MKTSLYSLLVGTCLLGVVAPSVQAQPVITKQPQDQTVIAGSTIQATPTVGWR